PAAAAPLRRGLHHRVEMRRQRGRGVDDPAGIATHEPGFRAAERERARVVRPHQRHVVALEALGHGPAAGRVAAGVTRRMPRTTAITPTPATRYASRGDQTEARTPPSR